MFNKEAKGTLEKHVKDYTIFLKNESERLAASRYDPDADLQVTNGIVKTMIDVHGHHVVRKPSMFYTYLLPILEAIAGSIFSAAFLQDNKTTFTEILMLASLVWIVVSIFMRHHHDTK